METLIKQSIQSSIDTLECLLANHTQTILTAAQHMIRCLQQGGKILCCGNGGSAADSSHLAAELLNRFELERQPLPAIALNNDSATLTAIGNDYAYQQIFSKQVLALGQPSDILIAISTSGNSANILQAIRAAKQKQLTVIALTGQTGGEMISFLRSSDLAICVPSSHTPRIQEAHGLIIHCLCQIIDHYFVGNSLYEENNTTTDTAVDCK
jgi:phosphoheptose isomerase